MPFYQTAIGGSMVVNGVLVNGAQNIFFAQLSDPTIRHFSSEATRYFSGEFIFMMFGLPGAALAMYQTAKKESQKVIGSLFLSAALTRRRTSSYLQERRTALPLIRRSWLLISWQQWRKRILTLP